MRRKCSVIGCHNPHHARGFCNSHFGRLKRHGDPMAGGTPMKAALSFVESIPMNGEGCLIWPYARDQNGYAKVFWSGKLAYVSRLVCEKANGPPPDGRPEAAHSCGKGHEGCVAPWHLVWKSRADNLSDKGPHGTAAIKLTEDDVRQIRALRPKLSYAKIGSQFGIHASSAHAVATRRTWKHVR